jgi:hypothetical protein
MEWITSHWTIVAFVASEILAILPGKYNGIAQSVWNIICNGIAPKNNTPAK